MNKMYVARLVALVVVIILVVPTSFVYAANSPTLEVGELDLQEDIQSDLSAACLAVDWQDIVFSYSGVMIDWEHATPGHCKGGQVCHEWKGCSTCVIWGECGEGPDTYRCCKFKVYYPCKKYFCCWGHK